jgi:hypothetical protein
MPEINQVLWCRSIASFWNRFHTGLHFPSAELPIDSRSQVQINNPPYRLLETLRGTTGIHIKELSTIINLCGVWATRWLIGPAIPSGYVIGGRSAATCLSLCCVYLQYLQILLPSCPLPCRKPFLSSKSASLPCWRRRTIVVCILSLLMCFGHGFVHLCRW